MDNPLSYRNKIILAPMVRIGTLPSRLLSLEYGADLVYTEELIDWKLIKTERKVNDVLGTVDFIDPSDGSIVFRTCEQERGKVVLQIGTCDPDRSLLAARKVENDVAAIDVNMGCPKEFSLKGGMGAALLSQPEKAYSILKKLVDGVKIPVSCKIRALEDEEATVSLCLLLATTGISAIAVHGRTKEERPQHPNRNKTIRAVSSALSIPVISNGGSREIEQYGDILKFREQTGSSSVMVGRAAEWNPSVFRKEGKLPLDKVIRRYLELAVQFDNPPSNTKYCLQNMLRELQESPRGKALLEAQTLHQICDVWEMGEFAKAKSQEYSRRGLFSSRKEVRCGRGEGSKADGVLPCCFIRNLYHGDRDLPKTALAKWVRSNGFKPPSYETLQVDKLFQSTLKVDGKTYKSSFWEKNKRWAEQSAATVCLAINGVLDLAYLKTLGVLRQ